MKLVNRLSPAGRVGLAGIFTLSLVAVLATSVAPHSVVAISGLPLHPPSGHNWLGTNRYGQDVLSQLIVGARAPLRVAAVASVATMVVAAVVGMTSGWIGGRLDSSLMAVTNFMLVIPRVPLLVLLGFYVGGDLTVLALVIALLAWPFPARVVRSQVLSLRRRAHLRAAVGFGAGNAHVLRRHIAPQVSLILIEGLVRVAAVAVFLQAGLAFLGVGPRGVVSWGSMIEQATGYQSLFYSRAWAWWLVPPVVAIVVLVLSLTLVGIGLEQRFHPRLARHGGGRAGR